VSGILRIVNGGTGTSTAPVQGGVIYGSSTTAYGTTLAGSTGQVLQSNGTGVPTWSTPTYPSLSGTAGQIIRSDGTNNIYSTSTFADTYSASSILYSNGANTVTGLPTVNGGILNANASGVPSMTVTPVIGVSGASTGTVTLTGSTGGAVTIQPQAAAGTYNFNLPTGAGAAGQALLSGGGLAAPMTFGTLGVSGGGTGLTNITANNLIYGNGTGPVLLLPPVGTTGALLTETATGAPGWLTLNTLPATSGILQEINGGTGESSYSEGDLLIGNTADIYYKWEWEYTDIGATGYTFWCHP
jgi:hypothetical protein